VNDAKKGDFSDNCSENLSWVGIGCSIFISFCILWLMLQVFRKVGAKCSETFILFTIRSLGWMMEEH